MVNETNVVLDRMECVCVCVCARVHPLSRFSRVRLFATLWTAARQAPLSMGFSRQECWSGLPCPPPGDLPNPGIKPVSLSSPALAGGFFTTSATNVLVKLGHFSSPAYGHVWGFGIVCVCVCVHVCTRLE